MRWWNFGRCGVVGEMRWEGEVPTCERLVEERQQSRARLS